jgi:hypothetical protein
MSIFTLILISVGLFAVQGLSAQKRVIKVQGHPHEYLTDKYGGKEDATAKTRAVTGSTANINLADIKCWAGSPNPTLPIDSAVLLIKFTGLSPYEYARDSILIWGYRWNPKTVEGYDVTKYTIDMIRAVANADCRFIAMLQSSSGLGFTAGGFGYNYDPDAFRPRVQFDAAAAAADDTIKFHYTGSPNCDPRYGQGAIPYDVTAQWQEALKKAGVPPYSSTGNGNGIIRHPFDADYGYPAYDFDYWVKYSPIIDQPYVWQSGWVYNYWSFYHKEQLTGNFVADTLSINNRKLDNHFVDGFVFNPGVWPPLHDMSGDYSAIFNCDCGCTGVATKAEQNRKRK